MPLFVRTTLLNSPLLKHQETSQRTRSLLFLALGAAAADVAGVSSVEIYESGVGALNLPLLAGMNVGARATRSCDLRFLDLMGTLASTGTPLPVSFDLPFMAFTKGEMIRSLREAGLEEVATLTTSCVHYPLRELGPAKQCGVCPACIGRRQALAAAGIADPPERYRYDLFSADVAIPSEHQQFLRANLLQVARLGELTSVSQLPSWFVQHAHDCALATSEQELRSWTELMGRYRSEWLGLVATCRDRDVLWAALLSMPARAA
jgi:Queuosine biosynthesis protein QueC